MKIHHIGIISRNINKDAEMYIRMGYVKVGALVDNNQKNMILLLSLGESPILELIEPINRYSTTYNFKEGYHHICFEVDSKDLYQKFSAMKVGKIFTQPISAPAFDNRNVVFACLQNGTFIEFLLKDEG